mmetsp:Transcript_43490/g.79540  ORF Transcript_43490/g.79540 Transcript_43490/m.79540 type:complete len:368 (-) Transcript_43490:150-1253(-)
MLSLPLLLFSTALVSFPANVHSFSTPATFSNIASSPTAAALQSPSTRNSIILDQSADNNSSDDTPSTASKKRRTFIQTALVAPFAITSMTPQSASAASEKPPPIIPLINTAKRLRTVPTFTIVDGNGIPFLTYDKESAGGFGYFFTSYKSAEYVLDDARKAFSKAKTEAADKAEGEEGTISEDGDGELYVDPDEGNVPDAWGQAQIVTIPLDVVMQLSVKKTQSIAQNGKGKKFSTFYQCIAETPDSNAALKIENSPRYSERGRVPLFYVDGLTLPSSANDDDGVAMNPVYFRMQDLKDEWQKQHPEDDNVPKIKVRELNETFRAMIRPGGKDESVRNLVFVPIPESVEKAKVSRRSYKLGEMILTK